jgi:hypothetical protein
MIGRQIYLLLLVLVLLNLRSCLFEEHMKLLDLELGSDYPSFVVPILNLLLLLYNDYC